MPKPFKAAALRRVAWAAVLAVVPAVSVGGCGEKAPGPPSESRRTESAPVVAAKPPAPPVRYDRDVRPILADRCFRCHGADAAKREADLRLDDAACATADRGGFAAIKPGDLDGSELWRRVTCDDVDERMPPKTSGKPPLSPAERDVVRRWIAEGAAYEPHWSFVPPKAPPIPAVARDDRVRNEIDRFIHARLEAEGIEPNPEADRETLARRIFLDLTGLPPTPEETDAFLADTRTDAYERLVDRLFDEEPYRTRYAERMTAAWLDLARYADTCGIHMDAGRQIWPWRDWVLRSFRDHKPFDAFLTEQIAGDLLPNATLDQQVASGFNRNHVTSDEGGAIPEEYLVEYAVDRTATTGSVFLGLTLGCARCHDHKYDPVTQEDFYKLYAHFNSIEEPGLYTQEQDPNRPFEPSIRVPSADQQTEMKRLQDELAAAEKERDRVAPDEEPQRASFVAESLKAAGVAWEPVRTASAVSEGGADFAVLSDGSALASGKNPPTDVHLITLRADGTDLRLLMLEALADPSLPGGRVGRAVNGNAVLSGVTAEVVSTTDPTKREAVALDWAWADFEQANGDYGVLGALDGGGDRGWAVDGHGREGGRAAVFLAKKPFGFAGGSQVVVKLTYRTVYSEHVFGRVRLRVGRVADAGLALLPTALGRWVRVGPFPAAGAADAYDRAFGPEEGANLDRTKNFGVGNQYWRWAGAIADGRVHALPGGVNATYVARRIHVPSARKIDLGLGSDDGVRVFLDGKEIHGKRIDRTASPDQDKITLDLSAGPHSFVMKIVNTGGEGGFYFRATPPAAELEGSLTAALLPESAYPADLGARLRDAWRLRFSPSYRRATETFAAVKAKIEALEAATPRTMIMKELPSPRPTFVLDRGDYRKPDKARPITRGIPAVFGAPPASAPPNRLGLAQWMTSEANPLVARTAVNRFWEMLFGIGLVRTSEDFGMQGEWPSHPELLDHLATRFRDGGWSVRKLLREIVTSATYRRAARARPELAERDPENRLLAAFPRRRLPAETLRDQALYVAGLLVEKLGGPSVKPYQPPGLWEEVAMIQSNTRLFKRDDGDALWRRSLYTYWKRAAPPPSMVAFDAPTRESCVVRRIQTNTPLQALVMWNDEQFVEASRALAQRTLAEAGDDSARLGRLFRRATGRAPDAAEAATLAASLRGFRDRYAGAGPDAEKLVSVGASSRPAALDARELAAWTLVAGVVLNADASLCRS